MSPQQSMTATAPSTLPEQSITAILAAEIMHDLDDGRPTLVASTQGNQGDLQEVTPRQLLAKSAEVRARLDQVERLAHEYEAATAPPADEPATWTFTHSQTGETVPVTCMQGCSIGHELDITTPTNPVDVFCWDDADSDLTLPIDCTGDPEDYGVLSIRIEVDPFHPVDERRLPHAIVEVIDDHFVGPLDPDAYELLINQLAARVSAMRRKHAELVRIRAEYAGRQA